MRGNQSHMPPSACVACLRQARPRAKSWCCVISATCPHGDPRLIPSAKLTMRHHFAGKRPRREFHAPLQGPLTVIAERDHQPRDKRGPAPVAGPLTVHASNPHPSRTR